MIRLQRGVVRLSSSVASSAASSVKATTETSSNPWHLSCAVCIERAPLLTPQLAPLQQKMKETLRAIEDENSKQSDHELRIQQDLETAERIKTSGEVSGKQMVMQTAADDEDAWEKDFAKFVPASCSGDEDKRSLNRSLDRPLHLLVQRRLGDSLIWDLPTVIRQEGESLRQVAERAILEHIGTSLTAQILGNAPWAHYQYKYSRRVREETGKQGDKVFIFKAFYTGGQVQLQDNGLVKDFTWARQEEIWPALYAPVSKALRQILYDEEA